MISNETTFSVTDSGQVKALSLFSGGLDSILATRVIMAQNIEVQAVKFVSPFFNYDILEDSELYKRTIKKKYGIDVIIEDITESYMDLLFKPQHGFGKNFNPCIDCKILMLKRAKEMMAELGSSFLITGEVLGQRPMSQRRDTLNVIERDSDNKSILLRPLCAKLLTETEAERKGLVDREKLLNFSGRGRSRQIALAKEFGITDFPSPAGGCILADPILSRRVEKLFTGKFVVDKDRITTEDVLLLLVGRQFLLPGNIWLIVGRNEQDNEKITALAGKDDIIVYMEERPGPTAILHKGALCSNEQRLGNLINQAAGLVVSYGKKIQGSPAGCRVEVVLHGKQSKVFAEPLPKEHSREWMLFVNDD